MHEGDRSFLGVLGGEDGPAVFELLLQSLADLGVPLAVVFGMFAFLLNFIPNVGSMISVLLPVPVVFLNPEITTTTAVLAIALPGAVQFSIGNIVEPKVMGHSLALHPVTVLVALVFWGMLWGAVGVILAVPMTSSLKILFDHMEVTRPVGRLLAGG